MTHTPVIRPLILFVEDDPDARLLYARELEMAGLAGPALVVAGTMFLIAQAPSQSVRQIRARLDSEELSRADARSSR